MKKVFKKNFLFLMISLFVFLTLPCAVNAQNKELDYTTIYDSPTVELNDAFKVSSISFKNNSNNSSLSFGITAFIYNESNLDYELKSKVYYYDNSYTLISENSYIQEVGANKYLNLILMSNIDEVKSGYTVDDIYYYKITFEYNETIINDNLQTSYNTPSLNDLYDSYDYVIDKYDININVNEDNTFDITETITANFNIPKHGIFRTIPLLNAVERADGTTSKNWANIKNLKVNDKYSTSIQGENKVIKIGDEDKTLIGSKTYVITYKYDIGKDPNENYDELYLNIIGAKWDTSIGNITFTINMPKGFDSSKLGFSSGPKGSAENHNVKYTVFDNVITGRYDGILNKGEALTIRIELEEGYFVGAGYQIGLSTYILFLIPIIGLITTFVLWYKFGKDEKLVETLEFYPPEGFNSLDVGYLYKGKANVNDVISLMIYLANKGYIKILEKKDKSKFNSNDFSIIKLKDYDGDDKNEQLFLKGLFKNKVSKKSSSVHNSNLTDSKTVETNDYIEVTSKKLYNNFYKTVKEILHQTNNRANKKKIFETSASNKKSIIILLIILSLITIIVIPGLEYINIYELAQLVFIISIFILFISIGFIKSIPLILRIPFLGLGTVFLFFIISVLSIIFTVRFEKILLIAFVMGVCCIAGMLILLKLLPKRTKYGNELLGKIKGFKRFLETAEKENLEEMVMKNPTYFYDILPFTYVLGVSDKWIKKFETISLQAPDWYDSSSMFEQSLFFSFVDKTVSSIQDTTSSNISSSLSSSSSSGGSSSGGGSSDGGSGGGGGGSW